MLRFNLQAFLYIVAIVKFQYILCYGSTYKKKRLKPSFYKFQYILCYGSTPKKVFYKIIQKKFQYILCYGSTRTAVRN